MLNNRRSSDHRLNVDSSNTPPGHNWLSEEFSVSITMKRLSNSCSPRLSLFSLCCCCGVNKIYLDFTLKFHPSIRCLLMWADIACHDWPAAKFSVFPIHKRNRLLTSQLWTPLVLQHIRYKHVIYPKRTQIVPSSCEWLCTPHTVSRSCNSPSRSICRRMDRSDDILSPKHQPKVPPRKTHIAHHQHHHPVSESGSGYQYPNTRIYACLPGYAANMWKGKNVMPPTYKLYAPCYSLTRFRVTN